MSEIVTPKYWARLAWIFLGISGASAIAGPLTTSGLIVSTVLCAGLALAAWFAEVALRKNREARA